MPECAEGGAAGRRIVGCVPNTQRFAAPPGPAGLHEGRMRARNDVIAMSAQVGTAGLMSAMGG